MISLYRDPEGLTVFKTRDTTAEATGTSSDRNTIETLRRRIRQLESIIPQNVSSSLIGEREQANLVVQLVRFFYIIDMYPMRALYIL